MLSLVSQQDNRTEGSQVRSAGQRRGRELIETSDWPSLLPSNDGARGPYDVEVQKRVELARGDANIDVWADEHASPSNVIAVECKNWKTAVTRHEVHAFRTVVGDSGANTGLLISAAGFQRGAIAAAAYSNVRLLTWEEFQEMFAVRWFRKYLTNDRGRDGPVARVHRVDEVTHLREGRRSARGSPRAVQAAARTVLPSRAQIGLRAARRDPCRNAATPASGGREHLRTWTTIARRVL